MGFFKLSKAARQLAAGSLLTPGSSVLGRRSFFPISQMVVGTTTA